jgi:uncharacterized phage-associated protein
MPLLLLNLGFNGVSMFTKFSAQKAVQAAAVILRAEGKRTSRLRLLKLLYLAERKCLESSGHPLIGGKLCIMQHGPLHSDVYDLIKGNHAQEAKWSRFIVREGPQNLRLGPAEPGMGKLSPFEVDILIKMVERHIHMDDWELAECTHLLPEVRDQRPAVNTLIPLHVEEIIRAACPPEYQEEMIEDLMEGAACDATPA